MKIHEIISPQLLISTTPDDVELHNECVSLWEMANLSSKTTGIDNIIIWVNGGGDKLQHGPRIKVSKGTKWNTASNSTIPLLGMPRIIGKADISQHEFSEIVKWININRNALLQYNDDLIQTDELIRLLKPINVPVVNDANPTV